MKNFKGNSGCQLELIEIDQVALVRKTSHSTQYNERLKLQAKNQNDFQFDHFFKVNIQRDGIENGRYFFDMDFIPGETLANFISHTTPDLSFVGKKLASFYRPTNHAS